MNIVYSLSRNLYPVLLPSIMSALDHNPDARVFVLAVDDRLPYDLPEQCQVIEANPLEWFEPDGPNFVSAFTPMALVRAATPKILKDLDKVIQLDVDTIVTDSLAPLWNTELETNLGACCVEKLGMFRPYGGRYFNIGVLLMNLKQLREEKMDDKMIEFLNTERVPFLEQDAWNFLAGDRIVEVDTRYNECFATGQTDSPAVVHYAGHNPWWTGTAPRSEYYEKYKSFEKF